MRPSAVRDSPSRTSTLALGAARGDKRGVREERKSLAAGGTHRVGATAHGTANTWARGEQHSGHRFLSQTVPTHMRACTRGSAGNPCTKPPFKCASRPTGSPGKRERGDCGPGSRPSAQIHTVCTYWSHHPSQRTGHGRGRAATWSLVDGVKGLGGIPDRYCFA